ncbi:MFS transporter [Opitutaceae bacterium TAV5]|nr:MFS transporter [Opitutaceae bacterium TAV5]
MKPSISLVPSMPATPAEKPRKTWSAGTLVYTTPALVMLFVWLLFGDFAWSMRERSVGPMAKWYLSHLEVPSVVFGLLLSTFPLALSFVLTPVVSVMSDRHRGRRGRRIPFLLLTSPLAAAGMIGLSTIPFVARWVHSHFPNQSEMMVSVICFAVFWAAFEIASAAGASLFGGLVNDVVPKELLGRFYGLFRAVSLIDGIIFNYWILGKVPGHFTLVMGTIGLFYGAAFTWVCLKVKEGDYPPPPPRSAAISGPVANFRTAIGTFFRECFTRPYYLSVFLMMTAAYLSFGPINTFSIPYARSLQIDMDVYGKALALTYLISLCLAYFIGWMADKFHPLHMSIASMIGYAVVCGWAWLNIDSQRTFLIAFVAHGVISGCFFTSVASLGQRLFPRSAFAQFASALAMMMAVGGMVLEPVVGLAIDSGAQQRDYSYTFVVGLALTVLALMMAFIVHRRFMRLGGPKGYVAPE